MKEFDRANLDIEIAYANGEVVIDGNYFGAPVHQEIRCEAPCTILFDPDTMNFEAVPIPKDAVGKNLVFNVEEF